MVIIAALFISTFISQVNSAGDIASEKVSGAYIKAFFIADINM